MVQYQPICEIEENEVYYSKSGLPFKVLFKGVKYALDCSLPMVVFINLTPTRDRPANERWVLDENTFFKNIY